MGPQLLHGRLVIGAVSAESGLLILNRFILSGNILSLGTRTIQSLLTYGPSRRLQVSSLASEQMA